VYSVRIVSFPTSTPDFLPALVQLFREAFEGKPDDQPYTWFVEGKEGIFDALDSLTAEVASRSPSARCATIAAHTFHIRFALAGANAYISGREPSGSWESSWEKQTVTDQEWTELTGSVRREYEAYLAWLSGGPEWPGADTVTGTLALLPHMAFHLGAIRQLIKVV
jgi:hypothetical protein